MSAKKSVLPVAVMTNEELIQNIRNGLITDSVNNGVHDIKIYEIQNVLSRMNIESTKQHGGWKWDYSNTMCLEAMTITVGDYIIHLYRIELWNDSMSNSGDILLTESEYDEWMKWYYGEYQNVKSRV